MIKGRLGFIVNPIAGMGGAVALKGTDGVAARAMQLGAQAVAPVRASLALQALRDVAGGLEILTAGGSMGEHVAREAGFDVSVVARPAREWLGSMITDSIVGRFLATTITSAADTQNAAREMAESGVDLLLFAGGDGTARDIFEIVGDRIPMLGIPAGVKMHSAVFATTARRAGELANRYLAAAAAGGGLAAGAGFDDARTDIGGSPPYSPAVTLERAEVMDRDAALGPLASPSLYGFACVPRAPLLTQRAKSFARTSDHEELTAACARAADLARGGGLTIIGPGTTTQAVKKLLGFEGTLDGVDLVRKGRLLATDQTEAGILAAMSDEAMGREEANGGAPGGTLSGRAIGDSGAARVIVSVIGGQGYLFGRGNQQISAEVIRRAGRANIVVVASRGKLLSLPDRCLFVDTGDFDVDQLLAGYLPVMTSGHEQMLFKVAV